MPAAVFIFIPAYKAENYLSDTIQSVLHQTYSDWELLVIDDCSPDETFKVATEWAQKDNRIKVLRNDRNLGMLENWNKGVGFCASPFFVKLDADDIWHPTMLEKAMSVLSAHKEVGLVFSRFINIDAKGRIIAGSDMELPAFSRNKVFSCIPLVKEGPDRMLSYPILRQGLSVMRKEVFDCVGPYRYLLSKETQAATDTEFYFRVGAHFKIYCIDEVLYQYRVHESSISATDYKNYLADKKLFEIKHCIISYYAAKGFLSQNLAKMFLDKVEKTYAYNKLAQLRREGNSLSFIKAFTYRFLRFPLTSSAFYFKRFIEKSKV